MNVNDIGAISETGPLDQVAELSSEDVQAQLAEQFSMNNQDPQVTQSAPANVVLSSESKDKDYPNGALPEGQTNVGQHSFDIPSREDQLLGFDTGSQERAGILVAQFRQFKFKVDKGDNVPSVTI